MPNTINHKKDKNHKQTEQDLLIPSIVSFSGGRTSAMMLLKLLEQGQLQPWRGDCVVFNNTSAEHAATYGFKGEVFEESISQSGVLPSNFQRNCTISMKILVKQTSFYKFASILSNPPLSIHCVSSPLINYYPKIKTLWNAATVLRFP